MGYQGKIRTLKQLLHCLTVLHVVNMHRVNDVFSLHVVIERLATIFSRQIGVFVDGYSLSWLSERSIQEIHPWLPDQRTMEREGPWPHLPQNSLGNFPTKRESKYLDLFHMIYCQL
jgi:hypothetical protein